MVRLRTPAPCGAVTLRIAAAPIVGVGHTGDRLEAWFLHPFAQVRRVNPLWTPLAK